MSIYEKMYAVMNESDAVEKSMSVGSGANAYKAVSEASILNMIKPLFKKHKLIIFPISGDIKDHCMTWEKTDFNGKSAQNLRAMTELKVTYRILDVETAEFQDVVGFGNGADPQDKGAGKAFTYSLKNVLSKTFMLFSGEDTDNEHSDDIGKPQQQSKPLQQPKTQSQQMGQWVMSESQKIAMFQLAKAKGIDMKVKGKELTGKDSSKTWVKAEYDKVMEELKKC